MDKIFYDENKNYSFNFEKAQSIFEPHELSQKTTILADVDFVLETEEEIICFVFKNAAVKNANNPNLFGIKIKTADFYENIAKKYYSTLLLIWACNRNLEEKDIKFVLLIEHPEIDAKVRKQLRNKVHTQLPFKLNEDAQIKRKIISEFHVYNMDEWKCAYPQFEIKELA